MKKIWKLHGLGNDFCFVERKTFELLLSVLTLHDVILRLCSRNRGIGCDGIVVWNSKTLAMSIWNSDGSVASTCGNALRCYGLLLYSLDFWDGAKPLKVERNLFDEKSKLWKPDGTMAHLLRYNRVANVVQVSMGKVESVSETVVVDLETSFGTFKVPSKFVQLQNPHWVFLFDQIESSNSNSNSALPSLLNFKPSEFERIGTWAQNKGASIYKLPTSNIGFVQNNRLWVYERGAGLTEACGSGACAAGVALNLQNPNEDFSEKFLLTGGLLLIEQRAGELLMEGAAEVLFSANLFEQNTNTNNQKTTICGLFPTLLGSE